MTRFGGFRAQSRRLGAEAVTLVCRRGAESIGATVLEQTFAQVWAGGDWAGGKVDLTVQSVEDGKRAAASIDASLRA